MLPIFLLLTLTSALHLDIPIFLDLPESFHFLHTQTQSLINTHLDSLALKINYTVTLHTRPIPQGYTIRLGYSDHESFFISPFGRDVTVFQTDALIVHSAMPVFLKDVVLDQLLKSELELWDLEYKETGVLDREMDVLINIRSDLRYSNWDDALIAEILRPMVWEMERFVKLDLVVDRESTIIDEVWSADLEFDEGLTFYVFITEQEVRVDGVYDSLCFPFKGAVLTQQAQAPLEELQQVQIIEHVVGQLFKVLGITFTEPKSPFIRLDFMRITGVASSPYSTTTTSTRP